MDWRLLNYILLFFLLFTGCNNTDEIHLIADSVGKSSDIDALNIIGPETDCLIVYDTNEYSGVKKVINLFTNDIKNITGRSPQKSLSFEQNDKQVLVFIGTFGRNHFIDSLIETRKIDKHHLQNKWETSLIQVIEEPFAGIKRALVIAGSDKRGTMYGMLSLSRALGVSPWYWWADVPVKKQKAIFIKPGIYSDGEPKVKYRGIFINDEAPALSGWAFEKFGGFNSRFYNHVFELILRLKGNFLWPAMWGRAFYVDDTLNPVLADEMGIVIGTSHHEPLMRAHEEWKMFGKGSWNYSTNAQVLDNFWTEGYKRIGNYESIVTIGMRGDGDEPMSEESNISLLESIVKRQREIICEVSGKPAEEQPQVWALYKEVLEYYKKGMRVPEDVTLLLCDDNWGNVRILPGESEREHKGGYGMYYHFDYVGGPRNYKWLNTNSIPRIWEQMHLTYEHGVTKMWIVNVGDIKPMELPINFFLDYAWDPESMQLDQMNDYTRIWAAEQFDQHNAKEIGYLLDKYTWYNSRRKPEMLDSATYSLTNYREFEKVVKQYLTLETRADSVSKTLADSQQDAFFQLVLFPIKACANLNNLHYTAATNHFYYKQQRKSTNQLAELTYRLFTIDTLLSWKYNHQVSDEKWNHFMDQTHIGYTSWQQPDRNIIPKTKKLSIPKTAQMGIWIEGDTTWWPETLQKITMPVFYRYGREPFFFEIYNKGEETFHVKLIPDNDWIELSNSEMEIIDQKRVYVNILWEKIHSKVKGGKIQIVSSDGQETSIEVRVDLQENYKGEIKGSISASGYVSISAPDYTGTNSPDNIDWKTIPRVGKFSSGVTTFPLRSFDTTNLLKNPSLDYTFTTFDTGFVEIHLMFCPTLDFKNQGGLLYALSMDDQEPSIMNMHQQATTQDPEKWVGDNIIENIIKRKVVKSGVHHLKFIQVDEGIVLQKIIIDQGGLNPSYYGPEISFIIQ